MNNLNVLIAGGDNTLGAELWQELLVQGLECTIRVAANPETASSYIANDPVDILVADFCVQGGDVPDLIAQFKRTNRNAVIVLCPALVKGRTGKCVPLSDVDLAVTGPCSITAVCDGLSVPDDKASAAERRAQTMDLTIAQMLRELGVPSHVKGYRYLTEAVKMAILAPRSTDGITKLIYPDIAKKYQTGTANIERAIRYAVGDAWKKHRTKLWDAYLFTDLSRRKKSPSNSQVISALAEYYRLHLMNRVMNREDAE